MDVRPVLLQNVRLADQTELIDVVCSESRIEAMGHPEPAGCRVIDCGGGLLMPAFVDVHSHADGRVWAPSLSSAKAAQGIGLEVVGNCGLGPAPSSTDPGWNSVIAGVFEGSPDHWAFPDFGSYLSRLNETNLAEWPRLKSLLPYGSVRASVAGLRSLLEETELLQVRARVEQGLEAGAIGVSLGLVYPGNDQASYDELLVTLQPLAATNIPLTVHVRSQANFWIEAIDEVLRLTSELGIRLLISHLCVGGGRNQWKAPWVLSRLREARRQGLDVWFDQHPYAAGSTSLTQLLPTRCFGPGEDGLRVVVSPSELADILAKPSSEAGWENYLELIGPERILIAGSEAWPEITGRTIGELQAQWGTTTADTAIRLLDATGGKAAIVLLELYEPATIETIAQELFGCFSTDSVHSSLPHPRLFGTYPYAFQTFCRNGPLSETEFIERSSRRPSRILGLKRSCSISIGAEADLVVVDPGRFGHVPDYLHPAGSVHGLEVLILGGRIMGGSLE